MLAVTDIRHLIPFLSVILHRLFMLLTCCSNSDDLALNTLNVIVVIVDRVAEHGKCRCQLLRDFVHQHFSCVCSEESDESTHSILCKYIPMLVSRCWGIQTLKHPHQMCRCCFRFEASTTTQKRWVQSFGKCGCCWMWRRKAWRSGWSATNCLKRRGAIDFRPSFCSVSKDSCSFWAFNSSPSIANCTSKVDRRTLRWRISWR